MLINNIHTILTYLTLTVQVAIVLSLIGFLFPSSRNMLKIYFYKYGLSLSFAVALTATLGSLFFSKIVGYAPCELCWYQRIFMYPQIFLLGLALIKKERAIVDYMLVLSFFGTVISLYHNYIYYSTLAINFCSTDGGVSCTTKYFTELGYITIPLMSLTAFISIMLLQFFSKKSS